MKRIKCAQISFEAIISRISSGNGTRSNELKNIIQMAKTILCIHAFCRTNQLGGILAYCFL